MKPNIRRCLSCQRLADRQEFWRIVRTSEGIQLDRGIGRSAYICQNLDCLTKAEKKNRLGRSLRINIDPAIFTTLRQRLSAT